MPLCECGVKLSAVALENVHRLTREGELRIQKICLSDGMIVDWLADHAGIEKRLILTEIQLVTGHLFTLLGRSVEDLHHVNIFGGIVIAFLHALIHNARLGIIHVPVILVGSDVNFLSKL